VTDRQINRQMDRPRYSYAIGNNRQTDKQINRQTDRRRWKHPPHSAMLCGG